jgi:cytochrome c553
MSAVRNLCEWRKFKTVVGRRTRRFVGCAERTVSLDDAQSARYTIKKFRKLRKLLPVVMRSIVVAAFFLLSALSAGTDTPDTRLIACLACHGANGQSEIPAVPSLGGQPAFYLTIQLLMFRERLRVVEPMNQMLKGLKDDDLREMATYLAKLPPPAPASGSIDAARMEGARALIEQHRCNFCHKRDYSGEQNVPRLAGQREDYLAKSLKEYKYNTRRGYDASMADVLYPISDEQILDLAYFLSRLR